MKKLLKLITGTSIQGVPVSEIKQTYHTVTAYDSPTTLYEWGQNIKKQIEIIQEELKSH